MSLYKFQDAEGLKTRLVTLAIDTCIVALRDKSRFWGVLLGLNFTPNNSSGCCFPIEDTEKNGNPVLFRTGIIVCCGSFFSVFGV